jgi:UDP-hydrolysing UDP-N-acetyl-D-glucosamine 2-epimerase
MHKRRIAMVTVARSDFSILLPLARLLAGDPVFDVGLWVGGAHFDPAGGMTARDVERTGLPIWARIEGTEFGHTPAGTVQATAEQVAGFGRTLAAGPRPDMVMILGDRFEAIAAALAVVPHDIPICHLSGGSISEGAIDDVFRHALTKMAALHFCDIPEFARRIHQMGEEPGRIHTVGALGLDGIHAVPAKPFADFQAHFGFAGLKPGYVLATLHPETRAAEQTGPMVAAMVAALAATGRQVIYTYPNADPGADEIIPVIEAAGRTHPDHHVVRNFGVAWFYTAMAHAGLVMGNSSSGIYEAASYGLPVVDIGGRQKNRFHGVNVLHCGPHQADIADCITRATAPAFVRSLEGMVNPYGDGRAAIRVQAVLHRLDWAYLTSPKRFVAVDDSFQGGLAEPT